MAMRRPIPTVDSPALPPDWHRSRWGDDDQRGNGNLMNAAKVLEAQKLIRTGEIVNLGRPYEAKMPIAPGRVYALRMPGGPTGEDLPYLAVDLRVVDRPQRDAFGGRGVWRAGRGCLADDGREAAQPTVGY